QPSRGPEAVPAPIRGNGAAIRSASRRARVAADAVAGGLIARHSSDETSGEKNVSAVEPMPEWERELLEGKTDEAKPAETAAPAEAAPAVEGETAEAEAAA